MRDLAGNQASETLEVIDDWEKYRGALGGKMKGALLPIQKSRKNLSATTNGTRPSIRELYRLNHEHQSFDFVRAKKAEYTLLNKGTMSVWEAMELLNTLVDDSDPDTDLSQIEHLMQTSEAIRADGHP
ncbi:MAG TPA: inositol oxygenase family protein, partial [Pyrinomonadaceae bacterium]|nr:inositol oxygenase family protein [Pyrinomonadaceae bacterium]